MAVPSVATYLSGGGLPSVLTLKFHQASSNFKSPTVSNLVNFPPKCKCRWSYYWEMGWSQRLSMTSPLPSHANISLAGQRGQPPYHLSRNPSKVKSRDSDESQSNSNNVVMDEHALKQELQIAIKEENYARAAEIRDNLRHLHEDSKGSLLSANARFYDAFRNGNLAAMQFIWANQENVYCVHPGAGRILGYELVIQSWEVVCGVDYDFPIEIKLENIEAHVRGHMGYVTCTEYVKTKGGSWGKQTATNVFERIDGQWFMCIHHASHVDS